MKDGKHILVDCGYVQHPRARQNADRLLAAMGCTKKRGHVEIVGFGRVIVKVAPSKVDVLKRFKSITEGVCYSWTTHAYDKDGEQFNVKWARP